MKFPSALAILPVLLVPAAGQDPKFESPEYGIKLTIPKGWTVDSTKQVQVILKLTLPGDNPFKPEIILRELPFAEEHITLSQYREQIRQFIQRNFRDPRIMDDRDVAAGGRPGFVFTTESKLPNDAAAVSFKGMVELSPSRLLWIECVAPKAMGEAVGKTYDALLASIEFTPRQPPTKSDDGLKRYAEVELWATDPKFSRDLDLEYALGDKKVGTYEQKLRATEKGLEVKTADVIDLGPDGRLEKRTTAFLSSDLARQSADVEIVHRGREGRVQYFTASVKVEGTAATIDRRINGEKSTVKLKVPERTVLLELLEALLVRLVDVKTKGVLSVPVLPAFDNEAGHVAVEVRGKFEMKVDGGLADVHITVVQREDGTLINYWYDADRRMIRRTVGGQAIVLQPRK